MDTKIRYKDFLKKHPPFNDIPDDILEAFTSKIEPMEIPTGKAIYRKGEDGRFFYMIHTGSVYELIIDKNDKEIIVSVLNPGGCFGAISILTDEKHLVTTKAKEDTELFVIKKEDLNNLTETYPSLNRYLNRILKNKLSEFFSLLEKENIRTTNEDINEEKGKDLFVLTRVTEIMNTEAPDTVLRSITSLVKEVMAADSCSIFLLDKLSSELILEASSGLGEDSLRDVSLKLDEGITGSVVKSGEPEAVINIHEDPRVKFIFEIDEERLISLLSVPLKERGKVIGALNIGAYEKRKFSYKEIRVATILANHIALAVSNARLRKRMKAISETSKTKKGLDLEQFVGETNLVKKINSFIETSAQHDYPILISGEEGTGKTLMAKLIHKKSRRRKGPFVGVDCKTLSEDSWGNELFGFEEKGTDGVIKKEPGYVELADFGTLYLTNIEALNKVNQIKLYNFMSNGKFTRINGNELLKPNVRIISTASIDLSIQIKTDKYNKDLYREISETLFYMDPLRKRRKDIPAIANYILEKLDLELHKNIRKISRLAMERLLTYDWPGNILELENVLRRSYLLAAKDGKIMAEQIFFGVPGVEKEGEFNLLSIKGIKKRLFNRYYPVIPQIANLCVYAILVLMLLFGSQTGIENKGNVLIWSAGWLFLYIAALLAGRIWCGICPFSFIGDIWKRLIGRGEIPPPKLIITYSDLIITSLVLGFLWIEGVSSIIDTPRYTAYLFLTIPIGASIFSALYERHVWCRYICPLGGMLGVYSIFSFITLKANRKICLSQCTTHECYLGGREKPCPLFLHPYGIENSQHCILCANCLKNCGHNSIHLPFRMPFSQMPYIEPSAYIFSLLSLSLCGTLLVENGSIFSMNSDLFKGLYVYTGINKQLLYTMLFIISALIPAGLFYLFNLTINKHPVNIITARIKEFGYAFIPISLMGHIAFYQKKIIHEGRYLGKWMKEVYDAFHIGEFALGSGFIIEILIILAGAAGSIYTIYNAESAFIKKHDLPVKNIKGELSLVAVLVLIYIFIMMFP